MDTRELLILLLGLAIVGVILRGLFVALQARRGQLRLAIDKNIPEVDLDALEMAELPAGGARVVQRSLSEVNRHNSRIEAADARARALDLADQDRDQEIPVLMDAVAVAESRSTETADDILLDYPEQAHDHDLYDEADSEDEAAEPVPPAQRGDHLSSVAPDYYDDDGEAPASDEDDFDGEDEQAARPAPQPGSRREPTLNLEGSFEDQLDAFSMSAGERIGGSPKANTPQARAMEEPEADQAGSGLSALKHGLFDRFKSRRKPAERRAASEQEVETPDEQESLATVTHLDDERESMQESAAPVAEPSEVLVINVMAAPGRSFAGHELMHVLIGAGMKFGDMNIFHQRLGTDPRSPLVFSVANILNPGTFDLNNMESFTTPGISLFLALPTAINNLDALDRMLKSARELAGQLGGELKDDNRNGMTAQTIEHYRQRVRDFELRRLKSAASRG